MRPPHLTRLFVKATLLLMMLTGALCVALLCFLITAMIFDSQPLSTIAALVGFAWTLAFAFLHPGLTE